MVLESVESTQKGRAEIGDAKHPWCFLFHYERASNADGTLTDFSHLCPGVDFIWVLLSVNSSWCLKDIENLHILLLAWFFLFTVFFFYYGVFQHTWVERTRQWTPCCLLPSFNNNFWHSCFTYSSNFFLLLLLLENLKQIFCIILFTCKLAWAIWNYEYLTKFWFPNSNFTSFNEYSFSLTETLYTYQFIFSKPHSRSTSKCQSASHISYTYPGSSFSF